MMYENDILINEFLEPEKGHKVVDLKMIVPIGRIDKNGEGVKISISIDDGTYQEVKNDSADGMTARYIKIEKKEGTSAAVTVYVGAGYMASRNDYWSDSFKRYEGWTGADGIYSFNITNGIDDYDNMKDTKTLFFFGDTLISSVDKKTHRRSEKFYMPNNTYAILDGEDPQKPGALNFYYNKDKDGKPTAIFKPSKDCFDFEKTGEDPDKAYYWLQDAVVLGSKIYMMPLIITEDKTREEGFQFRLVGVSIIEADIIDGDLDHQNAVQHKAELCSKKDKKVVQYGACLFANLKECGHEAGDGYVYIYGHINSGGIGCQSLCVSRVKPKDFTDWTKWRFFDGVKFVKDIDKSISILEHISCEMSVIPISTGKNAGKYLAVFQYDTQSNYTAYAIGENLWGPFSEPRKVFYCDEDKAHEKIYMYNAKAHLHLSYKDKILASYNVNASTFTVHIEDGHLYRPRFILLEDTSADRMEMFFGDAYAQRVDTFKMLNKSAKPGGAVFIGDSITQEFPVSELFAGFMPVYNRGIGGDTTQGLLKRLEESVFLLEPSKLFILIGSNDFALLGSNVEDIVGNISLIVEKVKKRMPLCVIHVISILPVNSGDHHKINQEAVGNRSNKSILKANVMLRKLAKEKELKYIDLHSIVRDHKKDLAIGYTRDGLHLSPSGYLVVSENIKKYL